jgi:hypothetical protein
LQHELRGKNKAILPITRKEQSDIAKNILSAQVLAIPAGFEPATHGVEIRYSLTDACTSRPDAVV